MLGYTRNHKLVFLGESGVGKSSIVNRFIRDHFDPYMESTVGAAFFTKCVNINGNLIRMDIWDTAGQERYRSLAPMYYRAAHVVVIVYDVNDIETYHRAKTWVTEMSQTKRTDDPLLAKYPIIYLVGNKTDLGENKKRVESRAVQIYANQNQLSFLEVSAKDNINIMELFHEIGYKLSEIDAENAIIPYGSPYLTLTAVDRDEDSQKPCCSFI